MHPHARDPGATGLGKSSGRLSVQTRHAQPPIHRPLLAHRTRSKLSKRAICLSRTFLSPNSLKPRLECFSSHENGYLVLFYFKKQPYTVQMPLQWLSLH